MLTNEKVLDALRAVIDPDFEKDIVTLGFIKKLKIDDGTVSFEIELTTPACPIRDEFKAQAEEVVGALAGVKDVQVTMTAQERPMRKLEQGSGLAQTTCILAVTSCKGGVGKSTVAAMLAVNLSQQGFRVGLLDVDIFGPSVPTLFNMHEKGVESTEDEYIVPRTWKDLKVMSFGFALGDQPAVMRGPMVSGLVQQFLHQVGWGELDYLVIDFPPGTGDVQLTISQSVQLDAAVIVTTPHELSLADVRKGIQMFAKVNVPVIGVIENMAYFECSNCSERHEIFGKSGAEALRERFGLENLAVLPIRPDISGRLESLVAAPEAEEATDAVMRALGRQLMERPERPKPEATATHIELHWSDGQVDRVENRALRLACACALCVDEMSRVPLLDPDTIPDDIHAKEVWTIGNYALGISWSDGHATGFFPFTTIKQLAAETAAEAAPAG